MREHSPFEASPIARDRKKIDQPKITTTESVSPPSQTHETVEKKTEVSKERIKNAQVHAKEIAHEIAEAPEPTQQADQVYTTQIEQSLAERARFFFGIPKRIDAEYSALEKTDVFQEVEKEGTITKTPPLPKTTGMKKFILSAMITAFGATHEPQIENVAHDAVKIATELTRSSEHKATRLFQSVKNILASRGVAYAETVNHETNGQGSKEGTTGLVEQKGYHHEAIEKFVKSLPNLSPEKQRFAANLLVEYKNNNENIPREKIFLGMEYLHGQITQEQMETAETKFGEITDLVRDQLAQEPKALDDVVRVAFELSKQRTMYAREKADLYSMIINHEGNCEDLLIWELSAIPKVMRKNPSMAVQVFPDHVRLLVRDNSEKDPWTWIDGHRYGTLTTEEMNGTVIVDPADVIKETLQLRDRKSKPPQVGSGYKTNSPFHWETPDGRITTRKHSDAPPPLRADEKADLNLTFKQASDRPEDHMRLVPVSAEFFSENTDRPAPTTKEQEKKQDVKIAPNALQVADSLRYGQLHGHFNELSPLEGISIERLALQTIENGQTTIDLSPLASSPLKEIKLDNELHPSGFEKLSFKNLQDVRVNIEAETFLNKVIKESEKLELIYLVLPEEQNNAQQITTYMKGPHWSSSEFKRTIFALEEKFKQQKSGELTVTVQSPFEQIVSDWKFDGKTGVWSISGGNYLSTDAGYEIQETKETHNSKLVIPERVTNDAYLIEEKIDLSKLKDIIFIVKAEYPDDKGVYSFTKKLDALKKAQNLETITIQIDGNEGELDLSDLSSMKFKKLIIEYTSFSAEHPTSHIKIKGFESNKVQIEHVL